MPCHVLAAAILIAGYAGHCTASHCAALMGPDALKGGHPYRRWGIKEDLEELRSGMPWRLGGVPERLKTTAREARLTQELQLAPELALLAAHAVHGTRDVVEVRLELALQLRPVLALPQPPLLEGHCTRLLHRLAAHLCMDNAILRRALTEKTHSFAMSTPCSGKRRAKHAFQSPGRGLPQQVGRDHTLVSATAPL